MSLRIQNNIEAFNAHRQLVHTSAQARQVDGEAVSRLPDQPRRRRRRRTRDLREAARPDRRPRPGPAQRAGRDLARADRRRRAQRSALHAAARPRARRPVQQRHALGSRQGRHHRRSRPALRRDRPHRHRHPVQRHRRCSPAPPTVTFQVGADDGQTITVTAVALFGAGSTFTVDSAIFNFGSTVDAGRHRRRHPERRRRPRDLRRRPEPPRAHAQQPRPPTRRTCRRPRAASATSTWRPRWSTSPSTRSSSRPAPRCSPRPTRPRRPCSACFAARPRRQPGRNAEPSGRRRLRSSEGSSDPVRHGKTPPDTRRRAGRRPPPTACRPQRARPIDRPGPVLARTGRLGCTAVGAFGERTPAIGTTRRVGGKKQCCRMTAVPLARRRLPIHRKSRAGAIARGLVTGPPEGTGATRTRTSAQTTALDPARRRASSPRPAGVGGVNSVTT